MKTVSGMPSIVTSCLDEPGAIKLLILRLVAAEILILFRQADAGYRKLVRAAQRK